MRAILRRQIEKCEVGSQLAPNFKALQRQPRKVCQKNNVKPYSCGLQVDVRWESNGNGKRLINTCLKKHLGTCKVKLMLRIIYGGIDCYLIFIGRKLTLQPRCTVDRYDLCLLANDSAQDRRKHTDSSHCDKAFSNAMNQKLTIKTDKPGISSSPLRI